MSHLGEIRDQLDKVSCSFCLAKWLQVTVHLQTGQTHSCHHPNTHKIPREEIQANPSALHNTGFKKQRRKEMLEGKRPSECDYCWRIEDLPGEQTSDRYIKSSDAWAHPHFESVRKMKWDENVNPTYVEVSFSHECNFKCIYCYPHISSSWEREIEKHGPYPLSRPYQDLNWLRSIDNFPIKEAQNPYVDAFWEWMPELYPTLEYLRVTGGEPLLAESTFRLLDYVRTHENPKLHIGINSNLGVPTVRVERFIESAKAVSGIQSLSIFTSIDTWGPQAEYIRTGLKLKLFEKHLMLLFEELPRLTVTLMCTFNALSVENFGELIERVKVWKKLAAKRGGHLVLDISYLRHPEFLSVEILPQSWEPKFQALLDAMTSSSEDLWSEHETSKMKRLVEYFSTLPTPPPERLRDFALYVDESDRRRNTNFLETFPTYRNIYESAKVLIANG